MADTALSRLAALREQNTKKAEAANTAPALNTYTEPKKEGNLLERIGRGAGYLGEKLATGFAQSVEGIVDFTVGGLADLVGADEFAEKQFSNSWFGDWYSHPDEWYDAGAGMQLAGDVFSGIGTSIPTMLAAAATGWLGASAGVATAVGAGVGGLSAAGGGVSQAHEESGELTGKEYLYGTLSGATEAGLELVTGKLGTGVARVAQRFGKDAAETVAKSGAKSVIKELGKEFASEGFEEGMSAIVEPVWKKITYDHDAEANPFKNYKEIGYSALVGGLSGLLMSGGTMSAFAIIDTKRGSKIIEDGKEDAVVQTAKKVIENEPSAESGERTDIVEALSDALDALEKNKARGGSEAEKKRLLAKIQRNSTAAIFEPVIKNSALKALHNADAVAERYNALGLKDANGNPITITAEQIRNGVDIGDRKSIVNALKTNDVLRTIAVMDAAGQLVMGTGAFAENVSAPKQYVTQDDINNFAKNATSEQFEEVSKKLNISPEMWRTINAEQMNAELDRYASTEEGMAEMARAKKVREAKAIPETEAKSTLPTTPRAQKNGTIKRYKTKNADIAIIKEDSAYTIYDYNTKQATRRLSLAEVQNELANLREDTTVPKATEKVAEENTDLSKEYREAESFARDNIKEYSSLKDPVKRAIERTIVEARANGLSDADVLTFAKFSAKSGINVAFNKGELVTGIDKNGQLIFGDGLFDGDNTIYVNKDSKRKYSAVIFHELMHSLYKNTGSRGEARLTKALIRQALKKMPRERRLAIEARYQEYYDSIKKPFTKEIRDDEITAHYTEDLLGEIDVLEFLDGEIPGLANRITSFFSKSAQNHSGDEHLSREARKYATKFRKLYNSIEERHKGMNAVESVMSGERRALDNDYLEAVKNNDTKTAQDIIDKEAVKWGAETESDGKPLHLYHGTKDSFTEFLHDQSNQYDPGYLGSGFYFTTSKESAQDYSKWKKGIGTGKVLDVYGRLKNPLVLEDDGTPHIVAIQKALGLKLTDWGNYLAPVDKRIAKAITAEAIRQGYDGVIRSNALYNETTYVVFDANQVKSADPITYDDNGEVILPSARFSGKNDMRFALDLENFDISVYNEVKLTSDEKALFQSEALIWKAKYRNQLMTLNSYEYDVTYKFIIDDDGLVHVYDKQPIQNIHKRKDYYADADRKELDTVTKGLRTRPRNNGSNINTLQNGREQRENDRRDNIPLRSEGNGNRAGYSKNRSVSYGNKKGQRSPLTPLVHTFVDVAGRTKTVIKVGSQYEVEVVGKRSYRYDSIDEAVEAHNRNTIKHYADKHNTVPSRVRAKLQEDPDFLAKERKKGKRFALDLDYLEAVNRGDMKTAQSMVDEAAKNAGYDVETYHGTDKEFTEFKTHYYNEIGYHVGTKKAAEMINDYKLDGGKVMKLYTKLGKTIKTPDIFGKITTMHDYIYAVRGEANKTIAIDDLEGNTAKMGNNFPNNAQLEKLHKLCVEWVESNYDPSMPESIMEATQDYLKSIGVDSIAYRNDVEDAGSISYLLLNANQVKSADPVTYDDSGKVIPLSKRFDSGNKDIRYALDLDNLPDTTESVGATRTQYAPTLKGKIFDATTKFYIDTVDETFGLQRYLEKVGKLADAAAVINMARASRSQAQTMIGSEQYDIFGEKIEKMGESLQNILAPINKLTDKSDAGRAARRERSKAFDDFRLHLHNISRMTLEERSLAKLAEYTSELQDLETKATKAVKAYKRAQKEIKDLQGRRDKESTAERKILRDKMSKAKIEVEALNSRIKPLKATIDNFEVMKNKPVFDANENRAEAVTAEQSQAIVDRYLKKYPYFKEVSDNLDKYLDNLQQMRVEAGLITQEAADRMKELYPHYTPTYRVTKGGVSVVRGKNNVQVSSTVKSAKGGGQNILNIQNAIAEQTEELMRAGNINRIAAAIYEAALESGDTEYVEIKSKEKATATTEDTEPTVIERPKNNQITFYYKGEKITMSVSRELFIGFEGLYNPSVDQDGFILKGLQKLNTGFKALITQYSPAFAIRNVIRDLQDAGINSKHPAAFIPHYAKAWKDMLSNSKEWQLYRAMGGFSSTVFTLEGLESTVGKRGFTDLRSLFDNINDNNDAKRVLKTLPRFFGATLEGIGTLNAMLEQVTRFAEFMNSLDHGADAQTALFDSAEVTTNFGRKGRLTKTLNATIMPFLNPAIQGFDKMIRNFKDVTKYRGKDLARAIIQLISKLAILGIAPIIANMWMYDDDDDYEKLRDADKENNFLIKFGDGQFIKIPRGRVAGVIGSFYRRSVLTAQGEDADWKGFVDNAISNVTPVENVSRTIFSPFFDVETNTTWYGSAIEGREFEDTAPRDRYDESTSDIAIAIGQILNYSPKKIHYLLDQYSGVIGDFALPATTAKNKGTVGDQIKSYGKNFVIDAETSNKISAKFYELYDEVQYAKTAGEDSSIYRLRYLNKVKSSASALYKEKKAIQGNTELSATDRLQQARVIQGLINEAQKNAMADVKLVDKAIEATKGIADEDARFTEVTRLAFGAQTALEWYNKSVYEKATLVNSAGIDYDDYYYYYFSVKDLESDKDKQGNTIEGSKRKKVISAISEMGLSTEQTLLLIAQSGYALKDGDIRGMTAARANKLLLQYIMKQKLTKDEKEELAKQCGFTVKNGKIILKS